MGEKSEMKLSPLILIFGDHAEGFRFPKLPFPKLPFPKPSFPKPSFPKPSFPGSNTINTLSNVAAVAMGAVAMHQARDLMNKSQAHEKEMLQSQIEHANNMFDSKPNSINEGNYAEPDAAPEIHKVCQKCYEEQKKLLTALDKKRNEFCEAMASLFDEKYYDLDKKTCNEHGMKVFVSNHLPDIYESFGGKNNECFKKGSEYLEIIEEDLFCKETEIQAIRCQFEFYYHEHDTLEDYSRTCNEYFSDQ